MGQSAKATGGNIIPLDAEGFLLSQALIGPDFLEFTRAETGEKRRIDTKEPSTPEAALKVIRDGKASSLRKAGVDPVLRLRVFVTLEEFIRKNSIGIRHESFEDYAQDLIADDNFNIISIKLPVREGFAHFIIHHRWLSYVDTARSHFGELIAGDIFGLLSREFAAGRSIPVQQLCSQLQMVVGNDKFTKLILLKLRNKLALHIYSRGGAHRSLLDELQEGDEAEHLFEARRRRKYRKRSEMADPSLPAEHEANRPGTAIKLRVAREELGVIDLFAHRSEESRTAYMIRATWERMMREDPALAEEFRADPEGFIRELEAGGTRSR